MTSTSEAFAARNILNQDWSGGPIAGVGREPQDTIITTDSGTLDGRGGQVRFNLSDAGEYDLQLPEANTVSLRITDLVGAAHVVTLTMPDGSTELTWDGAAGSYVALVAAPNGTGWNLLNSDGVTAS